MNRDAIALTLFSYSTVMMDHVKEGSDREAKARMDNVSKAASRALHAYPGGSRKVYQRKVFKAYVKLEKILMAEGYVDLEHMLSMMIALVEKVWDLEKTRKKIDLLRSLHQEYRYLLDYFDPELDKPEKYEVSFKLHQAWYRVLKNY